MNARESDEISEDPLEHLADLLLAGSDNADAEEESEATKSLAKPAEEALPREVRERAEARAMEMLEGPQWHVAVERLRPKSFPQCQDEDLGRPPAPWPPKLSKEGKPLPPEQPGIPCPFVGCVHHLIWARILGPREMLNSETDLRTGQLMRLEKLVETLDGSMPTCALRLNGSTLEAIGQSIELTRERARQIEAKGLLYLRQLLTKLWNLDEKEGLFGQEVERPDLHEPERYDLLREQDVEQAFQRVVEEYEERARRGSRLMPPIAPVQPMVSRAASTPMPTSGPRWWQALRKVCEELGRDVVAMRLDISVVAVRAWLWQRHVPSLTTQDDLLILAGWLTPLEMELRHEEPPQLAAG